MSGSSWHYHIDEPFLGANGCKISNDSQRQIYDHLINKIYYGVFCVYSYHPKASEPFKIQVDAEDTNQLTILTIKDIYAIPS